MYIMSNGSFIVVVVIIMVNDTKIMFFVFIVSGT
jgi:hypothetical protein